MKLSFLFLTLIFFSFKPQAQVHSFQTTKLKSTAGAGVGSILLNEAVVLNPASLSFFNFGGASIQYDGLKMDDISSLRNTNQKDFRKDSKDYAFTFVDPRGKVQGGVGYFRQREGSNKRNQLSTTTAYKWNDTSSIGVIYRYTKDNIGGVKKKYHQMIIGSMHVLSPTFSIGVVFEDPFKSHSSDTKTLLGFQYLPHKHVALMLDFGGDLLGDLGKTFIFKTGFQINLYQKLYLRSGYFQDKQINEKGYGTGFSWISNKFSADIALKRSQILKDSLPSLLYQNESFKEISLSLTFTL